MTFWLQGSADWLPREVGRSLVTVAGTTTRALPFCGEAHCYDWLQEHEREIGRVGAPKQDWGATWLELTPGDTLDSMGRLAVRLEKEGIKSMHARLEEELAPNPLWMERFFGRMAVLHRMVQRLRERGHL